MPPGGARLRYHMCMTCAAIARVSVRSATPIARHLEPDTPSTHYADCQPMRCDRCITGSAADINTLYTTIPLDLTYCIYLSSLAQRWITVDCEGMLRSFADKDFAALAHSIAQGYSPRTVINATHMRYLILNCPVAISDSIA